MRKSAKNIFILGALVAGIVAMPKIVVAAKEARLARAIDMRNKLNKILPTIAVGSTERQVAVSARNEAIKEIATLRADLRSL